MDLLVAAAVIALLSVAAFESVRRLSGRLVRPRAMALNLLLVGLLIGCVRGHVFLAFLLPAAGSPVLAERLPLFAAAIAGAAWQLMTVQWWRKCLTVVR